MNTHTFEVLELEKILVELKQYAATGIAGEIIDKLKPVNNLSYVRNRLQEVTAGKELLGQYGSPPFGGIKDLRQIMKKAGKDIVLPTGEILDVKTSLVGFRNIKNYFDSIISDSDPELIDKRYAIVIDEAKKIKGLNDLVREIDHCIDDYGEVKDTASRKLRSLRDSIEKIENNIRDKLESIIRGTRYQSMLQDTLITRRENRYVVPVKKEYRNTFSGIVHDQSASGMTIFMEPMAIVKLNNHLREVRNQEELEVYRILQELTNKIKTHLDTIKINLQTTSILDVIFARALYSEAIDGTEPEVNDRGIIDIKRGRHPLLKNEPVPIDIEVGGDFKTLIITGPNTGGKTVALKTVGLFVLMVETGLHIPAERESNLSIFAKVYADIGDEQSIEQNLSTFSSHMNKIRDYLNNADDNSLVLLDELGVGTDPREGAALGIAVLEELKSRNAITVATTHYSQLKSYAYSYDGVNNASVEFDIETLQPTYRIIMGVPGGSNAFEIALKLGIPDNIINRARSLIDKNEIKVEDIIDDLNHERKKYLELRKDMEEKNRVVSNLKEKYERMVTDLEEQRQKTKEEARRRAEEIIDEVRKKTRAIISDLKEKDFILRSDVDREASEINEKLKELEGDYAEREEPQSPEIDEDIAVGDEVRIKSVGQKGEVIKLDRDKKEATVQAGIMTVNASMGDLTRVKIEEDDDKKILNKYQVKKSAKVSPSLDLRGKRYEEAQRILDKYLDDAFLAGYKDVEIIHGKGTGALREAVQEVLEKNPHIPSYRYGKQEEGGMGVTIATIGSK